jgi:mannitol/fructose-specific phosphotransferase system IIA component (Ntr-type)
MGAFTRLVAGVDPRPVALAFLLVFLVLNLTGVRLAARVQVGLVVGLLVLLVLFVLRGLPAMRMSLLEPVAPHGTMAVFATAGFVFVSYGGLLKVASVAEEVKRPERNIPLGMILSLVLVTVLYGLAVLVVTAVVPGDRLAGSLTPVSDAARQFAGRGGAIALGVAAVLAFISTANAGMMAAARYLLALSRDRVVPSVLGRVNARFHTPHPALLVTAALMAGVLFLELELLVKAASIGLIVSYLLSIVAVVMMRESRLQNYRPKFRAPLYPWLQIAGALGFGFLLFEMGGPALLVGAGLVIAGFLVYWLYGRRRVSGEYALLHVVRRITDRELGTRNLESELREIVRERDEIVEDRFDQLIRECPVLDIDQPLDLDRLTTLIAEALAPRLGMSRQKLHFQLLDRESQTSTALTPSLAIPHVVIEGEHRFDVLVCRCRPGVRFSDAAPQVRTVFTIVGTRDERNFHLRALAAFAQIARDPDFERRWTCARDAAALRDIILLGQRRR